MADLRKRFIDILFEDDDNEEPIEDAPVVEEKPTERKGESPIKASDVMYRKSGASVFVNLNEAPKQRENKITDEEKPEIYEMSSQISPIFGLIRENKKKVINVDPDIVETQTSKPSDSHLDIITSPIYGYGNKEDAMENNYDVKSITDENEDVELHHLFDEEDSLNKSYDSLDDNNEEEISLFRLFGENK